MKGDLIDRVIQRVIEDAIEKDPCVRYTMKGMKLSEWQKAEIRAQALMKPRPYTIIDGKLYVLTSQVQDEVVYEPLTFGETQ